MTDHVSLSTLALFREALLAEEDAAGVRAHLAGCARCRETESQFAGMSELLAGTAALPMPATLSARIETALAAEAAARPALPPATAAPDGAGAHSDAAAPDDAAQHRVPVPEPPSGQPEAVRALPAGAGAGPGRRAGGARPAGGGSPRRTGRPPARSRVRLRALTVAAAVVVAAGGGYAAVQLAGGGGPAAGPSAAGQGGQAPSRAVQAPDRPVPGPASIGTITSGTDYRAGQFGSQVRAVLARYPANAIRRTSTGERAIPGGSLAGCVQAVTGGQPARLVDIARYQGRPAMIIVVSAGATGPARAWAVGRDCSATRPDVLARAAVPAAG